MTLSVAFWSVGLPVGFVIFLIVVFSNARLRLLAERRGVVPVVLAMSLGSLLGGGVMLLAAIRMWATAPLGGALIVIAVGIYLALIFPYLTRLYRAVTSAPTTDPEALHMSPMFGMWLVGPFAFMVWIASQAAR
ncbi:MAG TPA: hypothetical protein VF349_08220 [Candidatus Limnocylindrales bacterium]